MTSTRTRYIAACAMLLGPLALSACPADETAPSGGPLAGVCGGGVELRTSYNYPDYAYAPMADILFVIDNGPTMAEQQARLAAAAAPLIDALEAAEVDYHIAFTTTDNGNPTCPAAETTPAAGNFVLSSCRERLDGFVIDDGMGGQLDAGALACTEQCTLSADALAISPSLTAHDDEAAPRPWLEGYPGGGNLPAGTDMAAAFSCFAPQGIDGCAFGSPLESLYLALARAQTPGEPSHGFIRPTAVLAVVVLTDGSDCSYDTQWSEIFEADGSKVFWSDPAAAAPTEAVCWNAGVSCSGDPSGYDSCEPTSFNHVGAESATEGAAVLLPVDRYTNGLDGLETELQQILPERELIVSVIAGVEGGGASWSASYADAEDPAVSDALGIGPGCTGSDGPIPPPVRLRALGEAFEPEAFWSACDEDFSPALADLGARILAQYERHCHSGCVGDADRSTAKLEPSCELERWGGPGDGNTRVRPCLRDAQGHYLVDPETGGYAIPEGEDECVAMLVDVDGQQTSDPLDDLSETCSEEGNLEFAFARRPGALPGPYGIVTAYCDGSECPSEDCPHLQF